MQTLNPTSTPLVDPDMANWCEREQACRLGNVRMPCRDDEYVVVYDRYGLPTYYSPSSRSHSATRWDADYCVSGVPDWAANADDRLGACEFGGPGCEAPDGTTCGEYDTGCIPSYTAEPTPEPTDWTSSLPGEDACDSRMFSCDDTSPSWERESMYGDPEPEPSCDRAYICD